MNDNIIPDLLPFLDPMPFEVIGAGGKRASELDRDRAAIELAGYVIGILKFDASDICGHREELLKRANKVRQTQGSGAVAFVADTASRIRAAAAPDIEAHKASIRDSRILFQSQFKAERS